MAEKKEEKKDDKKKTGSFGVEDIIFLIIGLIVIFLVMVPQFSGTPLDTSTSNQGITPKSVNSSLKSWYNSVFYGTQIDATTREPSLIDETKFRFTDFIRDAFYGSIILAIFFSLLFWILKNLYEFKLKVIKEQYITSLGSQKITTAEESPDTQTVPKGYVPDTNGISNPKWEMIETYARSGHPAELRLAIIEADIMLFDILKQSGFQGTTVGEMLKNTNKSQLATLDYAWNAHNVRNRLAHEGSNFVLSRSIAESALEGYRRVFTELNLI